MSKSEILTARFYEWEKRGRGWIVFPYTIDIEPDFHPFYGHYTPTPKSVDDSKYPTLFSAIIDLFSTKPHFETKDNSHLVVIPEVQAERRIFDEIPIAYSLVLPKGEKIEMENMEQLFLMLSYTDHALSFEIVATSEKISIQFTCREPDEAHVCAQVQAYFPSAIVTKFEKGLDLLIEDVATCAVDFGLRDEFMRPLAMAHEADQDPYVGLFASLENLKQGECGVVQILFKGAINPWPESIMRAVTDNKGGAFFENDPDMVKLAQQKVSAPLFGVCVRAIGQAHKSLRAQEITLGITKTLTRLTTSKGNALQPLSGDGYPFEERLEDIYLRKTHRMGMLLNSLELATLAHFPTDEVRSAKVERDNKKTQPVPERAQGHEFVLGTNTHHGQETTVSVPASLRLRHTHILGATGTGKSTLLLSMISQDMQLGNGICVLDPHGDLIETVLAYVPKDRMSDVIVIDPADAEYPVGFNILSAHSEVEKDILSSDLMAAFKRLSTSWGDQMNSVFANAILAFLESKDGGTLVDLRRFLIEKPFRDAHLKTITDPHVVYYWEHEYPLLKSNSIGSILTRLDTFLRPKLIRNMVAQKKGIDFENLMDTKKIVFIKLSQGLIGTENSFLLGTFFVAKMYQAAMARQAKSAENRSDFFIYIDEFQNFITPSMSYILSGTRKYHLALILAHQEMQQVQKYDSELASSVAVNPGTRICFRLGDVDAKRFASGFAHFDAQDLENLHTGEAIARIEQPANDFNLTTIPLPQISAETAEYIRDEVIRRSRNKYSTPMEIVEQSLSYPEKAAPAQKAELEVKAQAPPAMPIERTMPEIIENVYIPMARQAAKKIDTQHRYLQTLIKRMAESRGYKAMIEETTPDGKGRVDVSLEKDGKRIACEVSVTTDDAWEIHNVQKCLAAGYDFVIVCSKDLKNLERIRKQVADKCTAAEKAKVLVLESEEVIQYFDKQVIVPTTTEEQVFKGYRLKTEYAASSEGETAKKHENVVKAVANSIKKKRLK